MTSKNGMLPDLPATSREMLSSLPDGWVYLGPRETPTGLVWEAASPDGVATAPSPGNLLHLIQQAEAVRAGAAVSLAEPSMGCFNRRRKAIRRANRESTLVRCRVCSALVFGSDKEDHIKFSHENALPGACEVAYEVPSCQDDDGTGDDLTLDDPSVAMAVEADL